MQICLIVAWATQRLLFDKHSASTGVASIVFLSDGSLIYLASAPRINGMLLYHLIKHSVILPLDNSTVLVGAGAELLIMHHTTQIGIVLRSYQLCLHTSGN